MSTGKDSPRYFAPQCFNRATHSFAIALGSSRRRWSERARLPKRQIIAQDSESGFSKSVGKSYQQVGLAVRPCAMGKRQRIAVRASGGMQKSANRRHGSNINEFCDGDWQDLRTMLPNQFGVPLTMFNEPIEGFALEGLDPGLIFNYPISHLPSCQLESYCLD